MDGGVWRAEARVTVPRGDRAPISPAVEEEGEGRGEGDAFHFRQLDSMPKMNGGASASSIHPEGWGHGGMEAWRDGGMRERCDIAYHVTDIYISCFLPPSLFPNADQDRGGRGKRGCDLHQSSPTPLHGKPGVNGRMMMSICQRGIWGKESADASPSCESLPDGSIPSRRK